MKCECNVNSIDHLPNECQRKAKNIATRDGHSILLCEDCTLGSDKWAGELEGSHLFDAWETSTTKGQD